MIFIGIITIIYENLAIQQKINICYRTLCIEDALFLRFFIYKSLYVIGILVVVNIINIYLLSIYEIKLLHCIFSSSYTYNFTLKPIDRGNIKIIFYVFSVSISDLDHNCYPATPGWCVCVNSLSRQYKGLI